MEALIRGLRHPLDVKEATGIMGEALELDPWDLEPFLETARERAERDALARELEKTLRQAGEKVKDEPEEALSLLRGRIETEDRRNREGLAENLFPDFSMDHLVSCLSRAGDGLSTGFKELDKRLRIPRGAITLIAGRPGHGKTRTLLNLLRRQMEMEPGKRYVFASYEEDAHVIITKLLISMARAELGENRQGYIGAYMKYLRGAYIPRPDDLSIIDGESIMGKVETAWKTLRSALESKRLIVAYRPGDARELGDSIRALSEKYGDELGAVFVDYMQLLPLPEGESISSAYQKVQAASGIMRDAAVKTNLPIICGAQLNRASSKSDTGQKKGKFNLANVLRPEYLREAGDLEQDANLAIGVYDAAAGLKEQDGADEGNIAPFSMLTMKNRNGSTGETFGLDVAPEFWRLDDEEQAPGIEGDLREKIGLPPKKNGSRVDAGAADRAKFQRDHAAGYEMNASTGKRWGD
jgi:replicative DNA helicase